MGTGAMERGKREFFASLSLRHKQLSTCFSELSTEIDIKMGEVKAISDSLVLLSKSQIASEFGMDRRTVAAFINDRAIQPRGTREGKGNTEVYRLKDVIGLLVSDATPGGFEANPDKMRPGDARAYYQAQNEKIKMQVDLGQLVPASEFHAGLAKMAKTVNQALATLPDRAERDLGCTPDVVELLETACEGVRAMIYKDMIETTELSDAVSA